MFYVSKRLSTSGIFVGKCDCWPAFIPNYSKNEKVCNFVVHAECVAPLLANFEYFKVSLKLSVCSIEL